MGLQTNSTRSPGLQKQGFSALGNSLVRDLGTAAALRNGHLWDTKQFFRQICSTPHRSEPPYR
jgi:hypothetical protein